MYRLKAGMLRAMWLCICAYNIPNASASADISHSRHGATTYSAVSGSMVAGRNLAIANGIDTCTPKRAVLVWEFYDQVDNKEGETIVEGSIINATFKSGETQVNLPLTTVDIFKPEYAPFALYTFISEELVQLKTLGNGDLSVSLDTSSHQGIDSSETFQLPSLDSLIDESKQYCLTESSLAVPMEASTKDCLLSVKGRVPKPMCGTPKIQTSVEKISKIFSGLSRPAQMKLNQPNWWESTAAQCGTEECYIAELGKRLGLLQGVKDSAFEPSYSIPFRSKHFPKVYLTCHENYNPKGEYQFAKINFSFEPSGPTFFVVYMTEIGVGASSWSWLDWSMVASGKISHSLKKPQAVKRRNINLSWELVEKMASTGEIELWNKYSAAEEGTFYGRYEFDADVVKACLSEHRRLHYALVDIDVLQETDGSQFLTIDKPNRTLTIHQTKEYEWFSTLFNNLQESQVTDHATVKVGVYDGDMTDITSHANTYSKVIDGHKAVVIALDEQGFMMFRQIMKRHLPDLDVGYISVYLDHSGQFYNGDFLFPVDWIDRKP